MNHENESFSDDRLQAYVLGFEDDPELEAAAAGDAALRGRLEAMRADMDAVTAGLDRVLPAPPDGYTDLGDERWSRLHPFVTAPAPATPRRRPTWLRVLAPAAVIALVLVAGVVGVQRLGGGGDQAMTVGADHKAAESYRSGDGATQGEASEGGAAVPSLGRDAPDPAAYETIVVARAASPAAGRQRFEVLRVLRGEAGAHVTLKIIDRAAAPFTLHILYLRPIDTATDGPASPGATAAGTPSGPNTQGAVLEFEFKGTPAVAQRLPMDADPDKIALP